MGQGDCGDAIAGLQGVQGRHQAKPLAPVAKLIPVSLTKRHARVRSEAPATAAHPSLGLILLPLMLYHQPQLFVCSLLAGRYGRRDAP